MSGLDLAFELSLKIMHIRYIVDYLNQPWVREEIGIDPTARNISSLSWDVLTAFWDAGDELHRNELYVSELLEHGVRVLIYAGTYDWVASWVGNERWTSEMEWSGQDGFRAQPLKEWNIDGESVGNFRSYGNLTFATIYGAGHMVSRTSRSTGIMMVAHLLTCSLFRPLSISPLNL